MHATHWVSVVVVCSREKKSFFLNVFLSFAIEVFVCGCAQDAFDSIHKTPIENYRPNCIFIREKQTEKPANQWRKVCAFFFHSLLLSCSTFLLFISLRLSSLVWHSIVFFSFALFAVSWLCIETAAAAADAKSPSALWIWSSIHVAFVEVTR